MKIVRDIWPHILRVRSCVTDGTEYGTIAAIAELGFQKKKKKFTCFCRLDQRKRKDDAVRQFYIEKLEVYPSFPMAVGPSWVMQLWWEGLPLAPTL